jgi:hypothetical protein
VVVLVQGCFLFFRAWGLLFDAAFCFQSQRPRLAFMTCGRDVDKKRATSFTASLFILIFNNLIIKMKISLVLFFTLLAATVCTNTLQAQDSVKVWKMEYAYYIKTKLATAKADNGFLYEAKNKGAVLYYTPSKYRVVYNNSLWVIGDLDTNRSYSINKNIAYEGLIFMPDEIFAKGKYSYLFAADYTITETTDTATIANNTCTKVTAVPSIKQSNISYTAYTSNNYPTIPWYPFAFTSDITGAFLSIERTVKNIKTEGIRLKAAAEINVPANFFDLPEGIKVIKMIPPPKL